MTYTTRTISAACAFALALALLLTGCSRKPAPNVKGWINGKEVPCYSTYNGGFTCHKALAHYRHAQDINRAKLADAMLPMRFAEAPAEGRE